MRLVVYGRRWTQAASGAAGRANAYSRFVIVFPFAHLPFLPFTPPLFSLPTPFLISSSLPYFYIFVSLSPSLFYMEYMEKLTNEENGWDHKISAGIKEGPADCVRIAEVTAVLKKMNSLIIP